VVGSALSTGRNKPVRRRLYDELWDEDFDAPFHPSPATAQREGVRTGTSGVTGQPGDRLAEPDFDPARPPANLQGQAPSITGAGVYWIVFLVLILLTPFFTPAHRSFDRLAEAVLYLIPGCRSTSSLLRSSARS